MYCFSIALWRRTMTSGSLAFNEPVQFEEVYAATVARCCICATVQSISRVAVIGTLTIRRARHSHAGWSSAHGKSMRSVWRRGGMSRIYRTVISLQFWKASERVHHVHGCFTTTPQTCSSCRRAGSAELQGSSYWADFAGDAPERERLVSTGNQRKRLACNHRLSSYVVMIFPNGFIAAARDAFAAAVYIVRNLKSDVTMLRIDFKSDEIAAFVRSRRVHCKNCFACA